MGNTTQLNKDKRLPYIMKMINFKKSVSALVYLVSAMLLLSSCKDLQNLADTPKSLDKNEASDPVATMTTQQGWIIPNKSPVIKAGDFRSKSIWNDPCVLYENGQYVMYMTSSIGEPFIPPVLPFRAVSANGRDWRLEPEQPLLDTSGTPFLSLETPSVVRYNGLYHLYYSGIYPKGSVPMMDIGHAVSKDGVNWKSDSVPVIKATGNVQDWNGFLVGEPGAVVYNKKIYLYFSAVAARPGGNPPQLQTIGLAISTDGTHFDLHGVVLRQTANYPPEKGFVGYSTPAAFLHENKVHIVHDVAYFKKNANPEWQQVAIQHAISENGTIFSQDTRPIFTRKNFTWTNGEILAPWVLVKDGQIKLWFSGHVAVNQIVTLADRGWKGQEFGIGYATIATEQFKQISNESHVPTQSQQ